MFQNTSPGRQNALIALLYDDPSSIDLETLLTDVDITPSKILPISTLDKICASGTINNLLNSAQPINTHTQPINTHTQPIINHTLPYRKIINAYAHGYNLINDNHLRESDHLRINDLQNAFKNGFCVKKIDTELFVTDDYPHHSADSTMKEIFSRNTINDLCFTLSSVEQLEKCTSLTSLDLNTECNITCTSFAKTLRKLRTFDYHNICDNNLKQYTMIEELHASDNVGITTCEPFAKSLKILFAEDRCGIDDNGLKSCTSIILLSARNNKNITTCDPFAKTLRMLSIGKDKDCECKKRCITKHYGMCDDGIRRCINIQELYAHHNRDITTCKPFAKSLVVLSIGGDCGIPCDELYKCPLLRDVYAWGNDKIGDMCNNMCTRGVNIHPTTYMPLMTYFPCRRNL